MTETAVLTTNEVAEELGTDGKTLRKFFRSDACEIEPVGQGKRYALTDEDIPALKKAFAAWGKKKAAPKDDAEPKPDKAKAKKAAPAKKGKKAKPAPEVLEDEDDDLDSLSGPSDDEIEDLDMDLDDADLEV